MPIEKFVELDLTSVDGNAFMLMGAFSRAARNAGWSKDEIDEVMKECQSGDYDHLVQTLMTYCR